MAVVLPWLAGAAAVTSIGGSIASGIGARKAAADLRDEGQRMAADALARGETEAKRYSMNLASLLGRQRAVAGAQGIDIGSGSAQQLAGQTARFGAEDIATIRANAMQEAYALKKGRFNQAAALRTQGTNQFAQAFSTALSFGANAWEVYNANLPGRARLARDNTRDILGARAGSVDRGMVAQTSGWKYP